MNYIVRGAIFIFFIFISACKDKVNIEQKAVKPNILILFTDDQRSSSLSGFGIEQTNTPAMNHLMKNGTTFVNSYILGAPHAAVCSPSRAMLMTGHHYFDIEPNVYAMFTVADSLRGKSEVLTFPEYFKSNGYTTFVTGKQHNGKQWIEKGFDIGKSVYMGGMTRHFGTKVSNYQAKTGWSKPHGNTEKFSSEVFADAAIDFLANTDNKKEDPFLMYVSFTAPHDPRTAPQEYHDKYPGEDIKLPPNFMEGHPFPIADIKIRDEMLAAFPRTEEDVKNQIGDYYAMIEATDAQINRILDALEKSGKAENTIIVFAEDNGLAVGQHGLMGKQSAYEHSIKIPLIFNGPGIPKDVKSDAFAYLYDVFPTLCGLTDLEIPEAIQSKNLEPIISGKKKSVRNTMHYAYNTWPEKRRESQFGSHRGVRKGDWKLILSSKDEVLTEQLFNLKNDPWELINHANEKEFLEIKDDLVQELKTLMKKTGDPADLSKNMFGLYDDVLSTK